MTTIDMLVRSINRELTPQFEERLRTALEDQDRDWLIDQIVRLTLDRHALEEIDQRSEQEAKAAARKERLQRVTSLALDDHALAGFIEKHSGLTREHFIDSGLLQVDAPPKGTDLLTSEHRSADGERMLQLAKDVLFGLLFGDETTNTHLARSQQELLTFALPRFKARSLDFMRASTELTAAGTWQDPDSVSNDDRADNVLLEVQYGDTADEFVGHGIIAALGVINNLEVNEQVLYARMINIEESTLIT